MGGGCCHSAEMHCWASQTEMMPSSPRMWEPEMLLLGRELKKTGAMCALCQD